MPLSLEGSLKVHKRPVHWQQVMITRDDKKSLINCSRQLRVATWPQVKRSTFSLKVKPKTYYENEKRARSTMARSPIQLRETIRLAAQYPASCMQSPAKQYYIRPAPDLLAFLSRRLIVLKCKNISMRHRLRLSHKYYSYRQRPLWWTSSCRVFSPIHDSLIICLKMGLGIFAWWSFARTNHYVVSWSAFLLKTTCQDRITRYHFLSCTCSSKRVK